MRIRSVARPLTIAGIVLVASLGLSGCTKPTPGVSVFSGASSVHTEAVCWAADSDSLSPEQCASDLIANASASAPKLTVVSGDTVGISVDPVIANSGWTPIVNGQRLVETPLTQNYFRFQYPSLQEVPADGIELVIQAGQNTKTRGIWAVKLTR